MYQLTVDAAEVLTVTEHPDRDSAHSQLMRHVVRGDYYLRTVRTVRTGPGHSTYELLTLVEGRRGPRRAGHAVIEELPAERDRPVDPAERITATTGRRVAPICPPAPMSWGASAP